MPGSGKQPPEIQEQIKELLEAGFDPTTIHRKLKVGRSSIYRMKRCLQQHGTNYMPVEMNKKNGRPKVLTPEQELEVREWLRDTKNRNRYLDDLVWLIHDRFGIVCSTTTMSKMKRKWLRVIEFEETGQIIDDATRAQLMETHPTLPELQQSALLAAQQESQSQGQVTRVETPPLPTTSATFPSYSPTATVENEIRRQSQQQQAMNSIEFDSQGAAYTSTDVPTQADIQQAQMATSTGGYDHHQPGFMVTTGMQHPQQYSAHTVMGQQQIDAALQQQLDHHLSTGDDGGGDLYGQMGTT